MKYLVGPDKLRQIEVYPSFNSFPTPAPTPMERRIEAVMNSCTFNVALAGVAGMWIRLYAKYQWFLQKFTKLRKEYFLVCKLYPSV